MSWDKARCSNLRSGRRGDARDDSKGLRRRKKAVVGNGGAGGVRQAEQNTQGRSLRSQDRWRREGSDDVIKRFVNRTQLKNLALISVSGLGLVEVTGCTMALGNGASD